MCATGLHHSLKLIPPPAQHLLQLPERRQQARADLPGCSDGRGRRHNVVATLAAVDMIVGVHTLTQGTAGQARQHFIHVHIAAGAGTGLEHRHRKGIVVVPARDRLRRLDNRRCQCRAQRVYLRVGLCSRGLQQGHRVQKWRRHGASGSDLGMIERALGLRAIQRAAGHLHLAKAVCFCTGCHRTLLS